MAGRVRSWFKVRFITGFFVTVPVVLTAWVLWLFYREVDGFLSPVYEQILGRSVPALGFFTAVAIIFAIGVIATNVVGRKVLWWAETLLFRLPVVRRVYPAVKELVEAFSPQRRSGFREFVLVEHPREGIYSYGFLTGDVRVDGLKPESLASVAQLMAGALAVETRLPLSTELVVVLVDEVDPTAAARGDVRVSVRGAEVAPPVVETLGARRALLYRVVARDEGAAAISVTIGSQRGLRVAAVLGTSGTVAAAATWLRQVGFEVTLPGGPASPAGEVRVRFVSPPRRGGG